MLSTMAQLQCIANDLKYEYPSAPLIKKFETDYCTGNDVDYTACLSNYIDLPLVLESKLDARNCIANLRLLNSVLNSEENIDQVEGCIVELWKTISELSQKKSDRTSDVYVENRLQGIQEKDEREWETQCSKKSAKIDELKRILQQKKILLSQQTERKQKQNEEEAYITAAKEELDFTNQQNNDLCRKIMTYKAELDILSDKYEQLNVDAPLSYEAQQVENMRCHMKSIISHQKENKPTFPVLYMLYQNNGEMKMSDLKSSLISDYEETQQITRRIYSLVASELISIDRSFVDPLVTLQVSVVL